MKAILGRAKTGKSTFIYDEIKTIEKTCFLLI